MWAFVQFAVSGFIGLSYGVRNVQKEKYSSVYM